MDINFHSQVPVSLRHKEAIIRTIKNIFLEEKKNAEAVSVIFCSDDYLLKINQDFLQHDTLTDIISFNYAPKKEPVNGELYISMDRIKENAELFNSSVEEERARVIFHGALHFCGYKDKSAEQKKVMRSKEDEYLKFYRMTKC